MKSPNALPRAILKALSASQLLHRRRKEFEDVHRKPVVRDLKNRCARVRVDRNDRSRVLHPRYMLHRAADPARDVQLRPHGLPAMTDLAGLREPLHVRERAGRTVARYGRSLDTSISTTTLSFRIFRVATSADPSNTRATQFVTSGASKATASAGARSKPWDECRRRIARGETDSTIAWRACSYPPGE